MPIDKKVMARIRKLLNLGGNNPSETEAAAALKKAAELAEEHGLALSDVDPETGKVSQVNNEDVILHNSRYNAWAFPLAAIVADCFDCEPIIMVHQNSMNFVGTPSDLDICLWYYKSIRLRIIMSGKQQFRLVKDQKSYGYGAIIALGKRLRKMFIEPRMKMRSANTTALVVVKKEEVKNEFDRLHPNATTKRNTSNINRGQAYRKGMVDGENMNLHRGEVGERGRAALVN